MCKQFVKIARKELSRLLKQGARRKFKQQFPRKVHTNVVYAILHTKTSQINRNNGLAVNHVTPSFISPAEVLERPLIRFIVLNALILEHNTFF